MARLSMFSGTLKSESNNGTGGLPSIGKTFGNRLA